VQEQSTEDRCISPEGRLQCNSLSYFLLPSKVHFHKTVLYQQTESNYMYLAVYSTN